MRLQTLLRRNYFFLVFIYPVFLIGCKRQMAVFSYHPESYPVSEKKQKAISNSPKIERSDVIPAIKENILSEEVLPVQAFQIESTEQKVQDWPKFNRKKKEKVSKRQEPTYKKPFAIFQKQEKPEKRKKVLQNSFFNDQVKIGGLFLGGAIILSLFNLTGLALLFGVAALLLLFVGFKKYFRRQRRKRAFRLKNK
ncbi:MAG: hypothetical protein ACK4R6_01225 [Spirosomataceae bacterium]